MWIGGKSLTSWSGDKFLLDRVQDFIIETIYGLGSLKAKYMAWTAKSQEQGTAV
jgi:hypothetical protein